MHSLCFHKQAGDDAAKFKPPRTRNEADTVIDVPHEIAAGDKAARDRVEGLGQGYEMSPLERDFAAAAQRAFAHLAHPNQVDGTLVGFTGTRHEWSMTPANHARPPDSVAQIAVVAAVTDPWPGRRAANLEALATLPGAHPQHTNIF